MSLLALALVPHRKEPSYQGRRLSDWAREYGTNKWGGDLGKAQTAQAAIRHIGIAAEPFLLEAIGTKSSTVKRLVRKVVPKQWHATLRLNENLQDVRRMGAYGIMALETNAPPHLIPKLIAFITTHPDEESRVLAAATLRTLGSAAQPAIPFLVACLKTNQNWFIRDEAAIALGFVCRRGRVAQRRRQPAHAGTPRSSLSLSTWSPFTISAATMAGLSSNVIREPLTSILSPV